MRKLKVIKTLVFIGFGFLLLQLISYISIFKQPLSGLKSNKDDLQKERNINLYILVYIFLSRCTSHRIPVFVVEPAVLKAWISVNESTASHNCVYFCKENSLLTLGVLNSDWVDMDKVIKSMNKAGLTLQGFTEEDPRYLSANKSSSVHIKTHYFIRRENYTEPLLHLVVFYTRKDSYFWHSAVPLPKGPRHIIPKITFGLTAGSYDRFTLIRARIDGLWVFLPHTVKEFLDQVPQSTYIECNYSRAASFVSKYGKDDSEKSQLFTRKSRQLLSRAKEILDDLGVRFWLSSGTCLEIVMFLGCHHNISHYESDKIVRSYMNIGGWFRQCNIIPYSHDVDIGIFIKDYNEDIINMFESRGLRLKHVFGKESDSFELSFKASEIKLDIFFFYEERDHIWNGGTEAWVGKKFKYIFPKFTLCWTELLELRVRVPCQTESYIIANYGKDWFVPVYTWNWKKSPPNVLENGEWPKEEWDKVMQVYE